MDRLTSAESRALSPQSTEEWSRHNFMDVVKDTLGRSWVDPMTPKLLLRLSAQGATMRPYVYSPRPITTVSYELYRTTTLWDLILYLNGYQHPDEIPAGATLLVPEASAVEGAISAINKPQSKRGTLVTT